MNLNFSTDVYKNMFLNKSFISFHVPSVCLIDKNSASGIHSSYSILKVFFQNYLIKPWLVWLGGLSAGLRTKGSPVPFPVRAHAWVASQVPSRGQTRGNHTSMFLSLSLSPSLLLSLKNKIFKKIKNKQHYLINIY